MRAYNPLIPKGSELVATVMFEIEDPVRRANELLKLGGVEAHIFLQVGGTRIAARPEADLERTKDDGKTSSVHFVHFDFTPGLIAQFRDPQVQVLAGIDHPAYSHLAVLSPATRQSLAGDFAVN